MKKLITFVIVSVITGGLLCYGTASAEHTGQGKYNNEDLEKFEKPKNAVETAPNASDKVTIEIKSGEGEIQDKEYWCREGTSMTRTISSLKMEINELINRYPETKGKDIDQIELPDLPLQERLNELRLRLRDAEGALRDLEDEAHRKGVPLGWIRCNF